MKDVISRVRVQLACDVILAPDKVRDCEVSLIFVGIPPLAAIVQPQQCFKPIFGEFEQVRCFAGLVD